MAIAGLTADARGLRFVCNSHVKWVQNPSEPICLSGSLSLGPVKTLPNIIIKRNSLYFGIGLEIGVGHSNLDGIRGGYRYSNMLNAIDKLIITGTLSLPSIIKEYREGYLKYHLSDHK